MTEKTRQEKVEILNECLKHYARMRRFVAGRTPTERPDSLTMRRWINEDWHDVDCPACREFWRGPKECGVCPLAGPGYGERERCCHGRWDALDHRETWAEFLPAMDKVIAFITAKRDELSAAAEV
jgi:hypothetical protein